MQIKVCRHTIMCTVTYLKSCSILHCSYKEAKEICDSMFLKYIVEDAGKKNFFVAVLTKGWTVHWFSS